MQVMAAMNGHATTVTLLTCLIVLQTTFDTSCCFRLSATTGNQQEGVQSSDLEVEQMASTARTLGAYRSLSSFVNPTVYHSHERRSPTFRLGKRGGAVGLDTRTDDDLTYEQGFGSRYQLPVGSSEDEEDGQIYGDGDNARYSITERSPPTFRLGKRGPTFRLGKRGNPTFRLGRRSAHGSLGYENQAENYDFGSSFLRVRKGDPSFRLGRRSMANDDFSSNDVVVLPYYFRDFYAVQRGVEPRDV